MKYVTLNDSEKNEKSRQNFNRIFLFSKDCGFIKVETDGIVISMIEKKDLESFRKFRYKVFLDTTTDLNTNFTGLTKLID